MPFPLLIPLITAAAGAIGGALDNRKAARTSTTTPTIAPEYKTLSDLLRARAQSRLQSSTDLGGYQATGLSNINDAYAGAGTALNADLARRGLSTSPVAGTAVANLGQQRTGSIVDFLNSLPLLQRQFQNEDMTNAQNVLNFGRGTAGVGPGSVAGGAFSSAAELLAYLKGKGAIGGGGGGNAPFAPDIGAILSGLGAGG